MAISPTRSAELKHPDWHPDGRTLIFHAASSANTQIYSRDLQTNRLSALIASDSPNMVGHISANGNQLVYSSERSRDREVYLYALSTHVERRLTNRLGRDGYPRFSPDGLTVAYHSVMSESDATIRVVDLRGKILDEYSCKNWGADTYPDGSVLLGQD